MNLTSMLTELTAERDRLNMVIDALQGYAASREPEPPVKRGRPRKDALTCPTHPDATFNRVGNCRQCAKDKLRDYQKKWRGRQVKQSQPITLRCEECGRSFADARALGVHKTKVHYTEQRSLTQSGLNGHALKEMV